MYSCVLYEDIRNIRSVIASAHTLGHAAHAYTYKYAQAMEDQRQIFNTALAEKDRELKLAEKETERLVCAHQVVLMWPISCLHVAIKVV